MAGADNRTMKRIMGNQNMDLTAYAKLGCRPNPERGVSFGPITITELKHGMKVAEERMELMKKKKQKQLKRICENKENTSPELNTTFDKGTISPEKSVLQDAALNETFELESDNTDEEPTKSVDEHNQYKTIKEKSTEKDEQKIPISAMKSRVTFFKKSIIGNNSQEEVLLVETPCPTKISDTFVSELNLDDCLIESDITIGSDRNERTPVMVKNNDCNLEKTVLSVQCLLPNSVIKPSKLPTMNKMKNLKLFTADSPVRAYIRSGEKIQSRSKPRHSNCIESPAGTNIPKYPKSVSTIKRPVTQAASSRTSKIPSIKRPMFQSPQSGMKGEKSFKIPTSSEVNRKLNLN